MNKLTKLLLFSVPLLTFVSCDTVEEGFSVGDRPKENEILSLDRGQQSFKPEGESFEVKVTSIAKWEVSLENNPTGQFSVSPTSGKGTGVVTVTCKPNSTPNSFMAEMKVTPLNFNMEPVTVSLSQSNAVFSVERSPSLEPVPEEGGSVTMTAYSSLNWVFDVLPHDADGNVGDIDWLAVTPGVSGNGNDGNTPIEFRFSWTPNYTAKDRIIRLQLKPSVDLSLSELPKPFTLTQLAGTLPNIKTCIANLVNEVDADVVLEYSSVSPVKNCGILLYKDGSNEEIAKYTPEASEFSKEGNYTIPLRNLNEQTSYVIVPFVENQVGERKGDSRGFATLIRPENIEYEGISIVDTGNGTVMVSVEERSASLSFTVKSDVQPLGADRISSVKVSVDGKSLDGKVENVSDDTWRYVYSVSGLEPNHEYSYLIEVTGKDLPREKGKVLSNSAKTEGSFKTKGLSPVDNDNNKPNVGS